MLDKSETSHAEPDLSQAPARRGPRRLLAEGELLAAACSLVQAEGLAGLTLRPLAQRLDVSVQVLSTRYGARAKVMAAIAQAALEADERDLAPWLRRIEALAQLDPPLAADLADQVLELQSVQQRGRGQLFVEMVQASAWDEEVRAALGPWLAARTDFWNRLARRAQVPEAVLDTGIMAGYFLDELAYSLALGELPAYRLLRRLCLRRLFVGYGLAVPDDSDVPMFRRLFDELDYPQDSLIVSHGVNALTGWRHAAAQACAVTVTNEGVAAVTHRAIAEIAGVPHSTLAYRFPTHEDLVVAGLEFIISHLLQEVAQGRFQGSAIERSGTGGQSIDIGRATFAVAIAASRMQRLMPCAADMRRQRGINLFRILAQRGHAEIGLDFLGAQVLSIGLIGLTSVKLARGQDAQTNEPEMAVALNWARQQAAGRAKR